MESNLRILRRVFAGYKIFLNRANLILINQENLGFAQCVSAECRCAPLGYLSRIDVSNRRVAPLASMFSYQQSYPTAFLFLNPSLLLYLIIFSFFYFLPTHCGLEQTRIET